MYRGGGEVICRAVAVVHPKLLLNRLSLCYRSEILEAVRMTGGHNDDKTEWVYAPISVRHVLQVWSLPTEIQG